MKRRAFLTLSGSALALASCNTTPQATQPYVDLIVVEKSARTLTTYRQDQPIKTYKIDLGFAPRGHKQFEGDGKTPEGEYFIWTKNPRSAFYLSLGISYPNAQDVAFAQQYGRSPGGDIFIHGEATDPFQRGRRDWTAGCIAVKNHEIAELYRIVGVGTKIVINP